MNTKKTKLRSVAASISIISGIIMSLWGIVSIMGLSDLTSLYQSLGIDLDVSLVMFLKIASIIFSAFMFVFGLIFAYAYRNPKGLAIILLMLSSGLAFLEFINLTQFYNSALTIVFSIIMLLASISIIFLTSVFLSIKDSSTEKEEFLKPSKKDVENKIDFLKELKENNLVSEQEYKDLLNKYLDNM